MKLPIRSAGKQTVFFLSRLLLAAATLTLGIGKAGASLTLDIRATAATGGASIYDGKTVFLDAATALGSTVTFSIYAVVIPVGGNVISDETFNNALFSVITSAAGTKSIHGDLTSVNLNPPYGTSGLSNPGPVADLNGDGDLDVGGPLTAPNSTGVPYIIPRTSSPNNGNLPGISTDLSGSPAGREWFLGTTIFTVDGVTGPLGNMIQANAVIPIFDSPLSNASRASYGEDGVPKSGGTAAIPLVFSGNPVNITLNNVPEPTAFSLFLLGSAGFAATRRSRARR